MTAPLLIALDRLPGRRQAAAGGLRPLARSLATDLARAITHGPTPPPHKARLTRAGGRCPVHAAQLEFDPYAPHSHRCIACDRDYSGEAHDRWWMLGGHLWLAERAVHASMLHLVAAADAPRGTARYADDVLEGYAERYLSYPNVDNVLGPSRPFFSTYLESIWLLQVCVALSLREAAGDIAPSMAGRVRDRIIAPSAAIIADYDEGFSNRQVWNAAALLAAARVLGDGAAAERAVHGPTGVLAQLRHGLLADGTWYEGENYHLFAHRGLWYGVAMIEAAGDTLPSALATRFAEGFATPFVSALPDATFPSRRDSQYAVSLRQWRFAELAEIGLARDGDDDARLTTALAMLYDDVVVDGDTGRARSTAEAERNAPAARLTRASLGWRSLLFATETLPVLDAVPPRSALLAGQGLAILRRDGGRVYAALDYGHSGGGHGHPDRLNVLLMDGAARWLDDLGTGSYVDASLHWYRSTLAHNAPLVNGRSQRRRDGSLLAWEDRGAAGWADAVVHDVAPGVTLRRAIIAMPGYLIEELSWSTAHEVQVDLPVHAPGSFDDLGAWNDETLAGGDGPEDGFAALGATARAASTGTVARFIGAGAGAGASDARLDGWLSVHDASAQWWRAVAPGAPGRGDARFHLLRMRGRAGTVRSVWTWSGDVATAATSFAVGTPAAAAALTTRVLMTDGSAHEHARTGAIWHIGLTVGAARSSIDLGGVIAVDGRADAAMRSEELDAVDGAVADREALEIGNTPVSMELGESHYRRSEPRWTEAGAPRATVSLAAAGDGGLLVTVTVWSDSPPTFIAEDARPVLDNESPEVNASGVQLHVASAVGAAGWRIVPDERMHALRVTAVAGSDAAVAAPGGSWQPLERGYVIACAVPASALPPAGTVFMLDLLVNDIGASRERRRGQLVLSGAAAGERTYLRGDRHDPARMLRVVLQPAGATR